MRKMEEIEWCNMRWFDTDSQLKRALLIGDSITLGYSTVVKRLLEKKVSISYLCTSKSVADISYLREISYVLQDYPVDVIHMNNGLHGFHLTVEEYVSALAHVWDYIQQMRPEAKLIWASSTQHVQPDRPEREEQIKRRNAGAERFMRENGVEINDLFSVTSGRQDLLSDGVHYVQEGYELLGAKTAQVICRKLDLEY